MKRTTYKYQEAFEILQIKVSQGEPKIPNASFSFIEDPAAVLSRRMRISPKTAEQYLIQLETLRLVALARTTGRGISGVYILAKGEIPSHQLKSEKERIIEALSLYKQFSASSKVWWVSPDDFRPAQIVAELRSSREFYRWIECLEKDGLVMRVHVHKNNNGHSKITSLRLTENFPEIAKT